MAVFLVPLATGRTAGSFRTSELSWVLCWPAEGGLLWWPAHCTFCLCCRFSMVWAWLWLLPDLWPGLEPLPQGDHILSCLSQDDFESERKEFSQGCKHKMGLLKTKWDVWKLHLYPSATGSFCPHSVSPSKLGQWRAQGIFHATWWLRELPGSWTHTQPVAKHFMTLKLISFWGGFPRLLPMEIDTLRGIFLLGF